MERYTKECSSKWQNRYSDDFKRFVCNDFLMGSLTRRQVERKYHIGNSRLTYWLREQGYSIIPKKEAVFLDAMSGSTEKQHYENEDIDKLKKELADARLLADAFKQMIEIAEKELKISIRKKSNTK